MKIASISIAAILLGISLMAIAGPIRIPGIYSNIYYHQEGGDLLGLEIFIFPSQKYGLETESNCYSALVQIAEGGAPFAVLVPISVNGTNIEFTIPTGNIYTGAQFKGTITSNALVGKWTKGIQDKQTLKLKRGKSYWQ